jgi:hypothetical protein
MSAFRLSSLRLHLKGDDAPTFMDRRGLKYWPKGLAIRNLSNIAENAGVNVTIPVNSLDLGLSSCVFCLLCDFLKPLDRID